MVERIQRRRTKGWRMQGCKLVFTSIGFDEEAFAKIREIAEKEGTTFSEQVRELVDWGLQVVEVPEEPSNG